MKGKKSLFSTPMKQEEELISRYGKDSGMRVPEGYFHTLEQDIMASLPPYPKAVTIKSLSKWQRVKPYVYLAAMFCGIWLMMKVFHTATQPMSLNLDNPPEAIVELLNSDFDFNSQFMPLYSGDFDFDDEEFVLSYDNIEDFEKDFYATTP